MATSAELTNPTVMGIGQYDLLVDDAGQQMLVTAGICDGLQEVFPGEDKIISAEALWAGGNEVCTGDDDESCIIVGDTYCLHPDADNFCDTVTSSVDVDVLDEDLTYGCTFSTSWVEATEDAQREKWNKNKNTLWIVSAAMLGVLVLLLAVEYVLQSRSDQQEIDEAALLAKVSTANTLKKKEDSKQELRRVSLERQRDDGARP